MHQKMVYGLENQISRLLRPVGFNTHTHIKLQQLNAMAQSFLSVRKNKERHNQTNKHTHT